jgi:hypothetical protein
VHGQISVHGAIHNFYILTGLLLVCLRVALWRAGLWCGVHVEQVQINVALAPPPHNGVVWQTCDRNHTHAASLLQVAFGRPHLHQAVPTCHATSPAAPPCVPLCRAVLCCAAHVLSLAPADEAFGDDDDELMDLKPCSAVLAVLCCFCACSW